MQHETSMQLNDKNFEKLRAIIHKGTGITIAPGRKSMLLSRLRSRLREINAVSFDSYIKRVDSDAVELQELINRVTTNKTYFYRTPRIWSHFQEVTVPNFLATKRKRPMRIWSGAASTGEEAHTIGAILEDVRKTVPGFDYSILGTDVSSAVLETAETGIYPLAAVAAFEKEQPDLFSRYMVSDGENTLKVDPNIRARIKFKRHNLLEPLKNANAFDAIFLRNVLIYFKSDDQETILNNVWNSIERDGILYIGESESLTRLNTRFEAVAPLVYKPESSAPRSVQ